MGKITGDSEDNLLKGSTGIDYIDGGPGNDTMIGDKGSDNYYVDNELDFIIENSNEGIDSVESSVTYRLPDNVEELYLKLLGLKDGYGNSLRNHIEGNCSSNYLYGDAGDDSIWGSGGNDTLNGGTGADSLLGGEGDDVFYVDDTGDVVTEYSGQGIDEVITTISYTIKGSVSVENLTLLGTEPIGGTGNYLDNFITGNTGDNTLRGMAGNDTINGGMGADSMLGGYNDDLYYVDNIEDRVYEKIDEGNDKIISKVSYTLSSNVENLTLQDSEDINGTGNELDNYITGNSGINTLIGGTGNDTLDGDAGNDILLGGTGNDTFIFNRGYGNDVVQDTENVDTLKFGDKISVSDIGLFKDGDDLLISTKRSPDTLTLKNWFLSDQNKIENIVFQDGTILTSQGIENMRLHQYGLSLDGDAESMTSTLENDVFFVDNYEDIVTEDLIGGSDEVRSVINYTLKSNIDNLTLMGTANIYGTGNELHNYIIGNYGNNSLSGNLGNDTLDGGAGIDVLSGGKGNDVYYVDNLDDVVTESLGMGTDCIFSTVTYSLPNFVEKLMLSGTDNIKAYGNDAADTINGNAGDNYIEGRAGDDIIYALDGNDTIDGGLGADKMVGWTGNDIYYVDNMGDTVTEQLNQGIDEVYSTISYTLGSNVENLTLLGDSETATGNGHNNVLTGNSRDNTILAGPGNDTLLGGDGNDKLDGSSGCDSLVGGTGNDLLKGGGNEDIYGGYDIRGFGADTILDSSGTEDRLELGSYEFSVPTIAAQDTNHDGRIDSLFIDFGNNDSILINNYFNNTSADFHLCSAGYGNLETINFTNGDFYFGDIVNLIH